jgi:Domain of unknown function (DUF397)
MDLAGAVWRKASSSTNAGSRVEVAQHLPGVVAARDSTDPDGPNLVATPAAWHAFTARIRPHGLDLS